MFSSLESTLKAELVPLLKLIHLMPSDAPPAKTGVQGREKGVVSSKDLDEGKVVRKVMST